MTPEALTAFLRDGIPLSAAIDVRVVEASAERVLLEAPLAPNINIHGTLFGGSAATLALLAAWSVLHLRLAETSIANQLVIQRTEMEYLLPVTGTAQALARLDGAGWDGFLATLERRGRARLQVTADIMQGDAVAGRLTGAFVALAET